MNPSNQPIKCQVNGFYTFFLFEFLSNLRHFLTFKFNLDPVQSVGGQILLIDANTPTG